MVLECARNPGCKRDEIKMVLQQVKETQYVVQLQMTQVKGYDGGEPGEGQELFNKLLPATNPLWRRLYQDDPLA